MATVAIVGCGSMGSVYAGHMARAGHVVHAVTDWPEHADAMSRNGLQLEGFSSVRCPVKASTTTDGIGLVDLVVIATKAADVEAAAQSSIQLLGPRTMVHTLQNGLGSAARVADIVGRYRTMAGIAGGFGASIRAPGVIHYNGMHTVQFAAFEAVSADNLQASVSIWNEAGFATQVCEDIDTMIWRKLLVNITVSAVCCITGLRVGQVLDDPFAWSVAEASLLEAVDVAKAKGLELGIGDPVMHVRSIIQGITDAQPSMLQDHLAQRLSEIGSINGAVVAEGQRLGVETPVNRQLTNLVKARESGFPSSSLSKLLGG